MLSQKDTVRAVISLVVALLLTALLNRVVKMSHLMGKFILPVLLFLASFYLLREFWADIAGETRVLEEGLSPQFLNYGHTNFDGAWDNVGEDDPDATQQFLPPNHPLYSELSVPRQNEADPQAFNASNVNVSYAYVGGTNGVEPVGQSSDTVPPQAEVQALPQNQACAVGGPTSGLCSQPNVYNPMNLVAPTPGPQFNPQRAAAVQERLNRGEYVPATAMM